jgi:hypothetical protein
VSSPSSFLVFKNLSTLLLVAALIDVNRLKFQQ